MSKMNWRNARLDGKRSVSVADEREYRDNDAAARWLTNHDKKPAKRKKRRLSLPREQEQAA